MLSDLPKKPDYPGIIMWINHLDFVPEDISVQAGVVGVGDTGLKITSNTIGEIGTGGGYKSLEKGLQVPPGYLIKGVRICYKLTNSRSFISHIRLDQLQNPPSSRLVNMEDGTNLTNKGPICVNSQQTNVDPSKGSIRLSFRVKFGDTSDMIILIGVGLLLELI